MGNEEEMTSHQYVGFLAENKLHIVGTLDKNLFAFKNLFARPSNFDAFFIYFTHINPYLI